MQQPPITNNFRRQCHYTHLYPPPPDTTDRQNLTPPHTPQKHSQHQRHRLHANLNPEFAIHVMTQYRTSPGLSTPLS
ncbi:hypothetical protein XFEB_01527 [Xylella fastidiosa EB92.1]|nr:hypothetical protein XFEB_01527 [Xylella fastidiosa EB92.1]